MYRNRDLWHPDHISEQQRQLVAFEPTLHSQKESASAVGAADSQSGTSLLGATGCNSPDGRASSDSDGLESEQKQVTGCNEPYGAASKPVEAEESEQPIERTPPPEQLSLNIQWALQVARSKHRAQVEANKQKYRQERGQKSQAEYTAQLQQWAASGDPVLVAEAERVLSKMARASGTQ